MSRLYIDLDGTLLDVSERYYQIYRDLVLRFCQPVLPKEQYWALKRANKKESEILGQGSCDVQILSEYERRRKDLIEDGSYLQYDKVMIPELLEVLSVLSARHRLYLVTLRKNKVLLAHQLCELQLTPFFEVIVSATEDMGATHTSPCMSKAQLVRATGFLDGTGVVVGDTEADILCGKYLGMRTCGVTRGLRDASVLSPLRPDFLLKDVSELLDASFN